MLSGKGQNSLLFLAAGVLMLPGLLTLVNMVLAKRSVDGCTTIPSFLHLVLKNLSLRRIRTMSAVTLLSVGVFTIIVTGVNRKPGNGDDSSKKSGTGGFLLWAESSVPVTVDLNLPAGAEKFGLQDETVLKQVKYIQLPGTDGDDASCLNLNQVSRPGLLGVPAGLFSRIGSFSLSTADPSVDRTSPWKILTISPAPGVINAFADQTVIEWGLRRSVGDTLTYLDGSGMALKIRLAGGLENSIFQGWLLVSDSLLREYYPTVTGSRIMLVDGPPDQQDAIARKLETLFRDYGMMAVPASARLDSFNAVENTYLSVFMLLGGLGVILGTVGLGIVLLRNLVQRRKELSLYVALGFRKNFIFRLILAEHLLILVSGVLAGTFSSLPVILPLLLSPSDTGPWLFTGGILFLVLINGFLWISVPARRIISGNILSGLREE